MVWLITQVIKYRTNEAGEQLPDGEDLNKRTGTGLGKLVKKVRKEKEIRE